MLFSVVGWPDVAQAILFLAMNTRVDKGITRVFNLQ